jgi:hypothetical protein
MDIDPPVKQYVRIFVYYYLIPVGKKSFEDAWDWGMHI